LAECTLGGADPTTAQKPKFHLL